MSLTVLTCYPQKPDIESSPVGSEAKNPLPAEVAGLSWLLVDEDYT